MIKLLSLFSGIGAFESALRRGGYEFQTINYCEIDKYASAAYSMIHDIDESRNLHDVRKVSTLLFPDVDLVTYGFPCQDISIAGRQKGFEDGAGNRTRSGLFFEALRIIQDLQPKWAICENVKALTMKKFRNEFKTVLESLETAGYRNYYQVLNAKDFGIPQNRERVFIVSIRKDIEQEFIFPKTQILKLRVRDLLEKDVPEKFFINTPNAIALARKIAEEIELNHPAVLRSVRTDYKDPPKILQVGNIVKTGQFDNPQRGRIYDPDGLAPTLNTCSGGGLEPKFIDRSCIDVRIRKLTPRECFRLMGFSDEEFNRIKGVSNTQLYKQAGNSIVVNVLEAIFKQLFKENHKSEN